MNRDGASARQRPNALVRAIPILDWLPHYQMSWLPPDLLAGLSVWALVILRHWGTRR
jgi:hypothetical protein